MEQKILALDIGGTSCKISVVDTEGKILRRDEFPVDTNHYEVPIIDTVIQEAKRFLGKESVIGIACSATGQIDAEKGTVIGTNGSIPNYEGCEIGKRLSEAFSLPCTVINDADCMILAEKWLGNAKDCQNAVGITIGTGIGGGILADGKILLGSRGIAAEIGHMSIDEHGDACTCGSRGCYENYASAKALVHLAEERLHRTGLNGRIIFAEAEAGNKDMQAVLDEWMDSVAIGIVSLVHIFNPEAVIIGGGVSAQQKLFIEPLAAKVKAMVMPRFREGLRIEAAKFRNDAGMIGAVCYFMDHQKEGKETNE